MNHPRLLIVHPDPSAIELMTSMLQTFGLDIEHAPSDRAAVRLLEHEAVDLVLAACEPTDPEGLELLICLRRKHPEIPVMLLFSGEHPERTREALARGAANVLKFPLPANHLRAAVAQALGQPEPPPATAAGTTRFPTVAATPGPYLNGRADHPTPEPVVEPVRKAGGLELVGGHPVFCQALELAEMIAPTRTPVLILGERGTGKTLLARTLHDQSPFRGGPFVEVACGALKESALEVELFGRRFHGLGEHHPAAERPGKLSQAQRGTLFLDEVESLSPDLQFKLLRLLQDGQFEPVGSTQTIQSDVRIILGSREGLVKLVEQGLFRQDLYYRASVVTLKLPPLRHRGADIERLAEHFRDRFNRELGKQVVGFSPEALELLRKHEWPGNVHELENAIKRGVLTCRGSWMEPAHLALNPGEPRPVGSPVHSSRPSLPAGLRPLKEALEEPERQIILQALEALNWNRQETARVLDINRTTLYKKMKKYGLLHDEPAWV